MNRHPAAADPLYNKAVEFIAKEQSVSISQIQRKYIIGYTRAGNLVDAMEAAGAVTKPGRTGIRGVLIPNPDQKAGPDL